MNFLKIEKINFQPPYKKEIIESDVNKRIQELESFTQADEGLFVIQVRPGVGTVHQLKQIYQNQESTFISTAFNDFHIKLNEMPNEFVLIDAACSTRLSEIVLNQTLKIIINRSFKKAIVVTFEDEASVNEILNNLFGNK